MADNRKTLTAPKSAVERAKALSEAGAAYPFERVREVIAGGDAAVAGVDTVVAAKAPRRSPSGPHRGQEAVPEIGLHPTGELEPTVRQSLVDTVSKLFGGALTVKLSRVRKAIAEIERKAAQDTSTDGPTKRRREIAAQHLGVRKPKAPDRPHKVRGTLDVYGVHLTKSERDIFERFVKDAELATAVNITSRIYHAMPRGGSSAPPSSHITEAQRIAYTRFYFVWRNLGAQFQTICGAAVLEVRSEAMGRPFSLEEIGSQATNYSDRGLCRAAALGLTKATLWRLAELYLEWNGMDEEAQKVLVEANDEIEAARAERLGRVRRGETQGVGDKMALGPKAGGAL